MYANCLSCSSPLGINDVLESFLVGKRLAFDAQRGRLWIVCPSCGRWCLSPLEERWEAIEQAERVFRATRTRLSTDQIGLARTASGVDLIRVGKPLRPEFAAWRYGEQMGRRTRRALVRTSVVSGALLTVSLGTTGAMLLPEYSPAMLWLMFGGLGVQQLHTVGDLWNRKRRVIARHATSDGVILRQSHPHLARTRIVGDNEFGWAMRLSYRGRRDGVKLDGMTLFRYERSEQLLRGVDAQRALSKMLPICNRDFGSRKVVSGAVNYLDQDVTADKLLARITTRYHDTRRWPDDSGEGTLSALQPDLRLAIEMAMHEDEERRALEGELAELERAWQDAEAIASIADNLIVPQSVTTKLSSYREAK